MRSASRRASARSWSLLLSFQLVVRWASALTSNRPRKQTVADVLPDTHLISRLSLSLTRWPWRDCDSSNTLTEFKRKQSRSDTSRVARSIVEKTKQRVQCTVGAIFALSARFLILSFDSYAECSPACASGAAKLAPAYRRIATRKLLILQFHQIASVRYL